MKKYNLIKTILFVVLGVLVEIFNGFCEEHISYVVGGCMALFGLDILLENIFSKKLFNHSTQLAEIIVLFVLSFVTIWLGSEDFVLTCIIWAVWSIDRESIEITHKVIHNHKHKLTAIINGLESIVVIILSILLIHNPVEHCHLHVILLGIELILEVTWPLLNKLEKKEG